MKKTLVATLFLILSAGALSAGQVVEAVIARVGDRIITRSAYLDRLKLGYAEIEATLPPEQVEARKAEYRDQLLNEMLSELLLKDRADRIGLTVSQKELDEAVDRLKQQYGLQTDEEFAESLSRSGMTRVEMESRLRETLLTNKLFGRELRSRAELSDRELRERYEREKEEYRLPERAKVKELVLITPDGADDAAVQALQAKAERLASEARGGADFVKLILENSQAPSKDNAGDLGTISKGDLIAELDVAVFSAPAGTIVGPVRTRSGFHILKVEERLPSELPSFDSVKERLRREADDETFQRDFKAYIENLRKDAYVHINEDQVPNTL